MEVISPQPKFFNNRNFTFFLEKEGVLRLRVEKKWKMIVIGGFYSTQKKAFF